MYARERQRGVSLIEVLVAVLIFSIGLIGLAGLLVMATRSNQVAYLRTQASFLASGMADRMRANPWGVWSGSYNGNYPTTTNQTCDSTSACSPANLAVRDKFVWSNALSEFLPGVSASINCAAGGAAPADFMSRPPYGGSCVMKIFWAEQAVMGTGQAAAQQTLSLTFQP
ncbi:MAG: type IV pilus modification protein PilV [Dyella sp.]